jgi:hypothetical protein
VPALREPAVTATRVYTALSWDFERDLSTPAARLDVSAVRGYDRHARGGAAVPGRRFPTRIRDMILTHATNDERLDGKGNRSYL